MKVLRNGKSVEKVEPRRFRHIKRGSTYQLIGVADLQSSFDIHEGCLLAIYRCEADGRLWARPAVEFNDGRFEEIQS